VTEQSMHDLKADADECEENPDAHPYALRRSTFTVRGVTKRNRKEDCGNRKKQDSNRCRAHRLQDCHE
jgi:hypothetical protein